MIKIITTIEQVKEKHLFYSIKSKKIKKAGPSSIDMTGVEIDGFVVEEFAGRVRNKRKTNSLWKLVNKDSEEVLYLKGNLIRLMIKGRSKTG